LSIPFLKTKEADFYGSCGFLPKISKHVTVSKFYGLKQIYILYNPGPGPEFPACGKQIHIINTHLNNSVNINQNIY